MITRMPIAAGTLATVLLAGCGAQSGTDATAASPGAPPAARPTTSVTASGAGPLRVTNCGGVYTYTGTPERIVTSSTVATEVVLALGLKDRLAGTVAAKDILPAYAADLKGVKVIAESAFPPPSREVVYSAGPDLVVSGYPDDYGPKAMGDRARLRQDGVNTHLLSASCPGHTASVEDTYTDLRDLGRIFGVEARAEELVTALRSEVDAVTPRTPALRVLDYAGGKEKPLTTGS
ncbi:ABC transporter substrate-binding protein, partial [Streptosporangium sp. NPDC048865]|uniref:ABC transporter substrate-binding protein n=1 Tax=Streptosporangium sp. NPDC048865 TaxID=3155766 RepID=UPI003448C08F